MVHFTLNTRCTLSSVQVTEETMYLFIFTFFSLSIIGSFIGGSVLHIPLCFQNTVVSTCTWHTKQNSTSSQILCSSTESPDCSNTSSLVECSESGLPECGYNSSIECSSGLPNCSSLGRNVTCLWTSKENFAVSENIVFKVKYVFYWNLCLYKTFF